MRLCKLQGFFMKGGLMVLGMCLLLLFTSCSFPGVVYFDGQLPQVKQAPTAPALPPIRFPQDEAAHNDLTEWWYYTGHFQATAANGKQHIYGFELVIFQGLRSDIPPAYAAHFAISDVTRGEFHFDQRRAIEPNAIIPNGTSTKGIDEHVGDWSMQGLNGQDHLAANMQNYAIQLNLMSQKPATLHNGNGLITYGLAGFSYYYSRTRMAVSGTIVDHGQSLQVTGLAWMDHQWGNFLNLGGGGWDWYSVQLNNDTEMMVYFIRDASGKMLSTYVGYIDAQSNDHLIAVNNITSTPLSYWKSPKTGANYPSGWHLVVNDSQLHAYLTITPQLKDQELVVYQSTGNSYWEGAVSINGQSNGQALRGEGYVELTGYAHGQ